MRRSTRLPTSRSSHVEKHGLVYAWDAPFWDSWYPKNGFNCLCTTMTVSESLLLRRGWRLAVSNVGDEPDDGFTTNPAKETEI